MFSALTKNFEMMRSLEGYMALLNGLIWVSIFHLLDSLDWEIVDKHQMRRRGKRVAWEGVKILYTFLDEQKSRLPESKHA